MKKILLVSVLVTGIVGCSFSMKIEKFEDTDKFVRTILSSQGKIEEKRNCIRATVEQLGASAPLSIEFRVAALDEIRNQLSDDFPFISDLVEETIRKVVGKNLYEEGREGELGRMLFAAQKPRIALDVLLRAVRLLSMYDNDFFTKNVEPFMKLKRLGSYL